MKNNDFLTHLEHDNQKTVSVLIEMCIYKGRKWQDTGKQPKQKKKAG